MTTNLDKNLASFLPVSVVDAELAKRGNQSTTVTFVKKDGTTQTRTGLPKVYKRRVGGERGAIAAKALKDNGNVFFDYPNAAKRKDGKRGFSFNKGRVVSIGNAGV